MYICSRKKKAYIYNYEKLKKNNNGDIDIIISKDYNQKTKVEVNNIIDNNLTLKDKYDPKAFQDLQHLLFLKKNSKVFLNKKSISKIRFI